MDGMRRRVQVAGDGRGELSGACLGYLDAHPCGWIENHRTGLRVDWSSQVRNAALAAQDRARANSQAAERREEREKARAEQYERTAEEAVARWSVAKPVDGRNHPCLERKGVRSFGLREDEQGNLLVPLRDIHGKLWSLQSIEPDGTQSIPRNSSMAGKFYAMGPVGTRTMFIAQGYPTAATLVEATRQAAVVAFSPGNLEPVARALRERHPDRTIFIVADGEQKRELDGKPNGSRQQAEEAARAVGGHVLVPRFERGQGTNWNDLARTAGIEEVQAQLEVGLARAQRQELAAVEEQAQRAARQSRMETREPARAEISL
jgi:putative DNA primase/helicase